MLRIGPPSENRGLRNILVAEATFLDTSRMQPRYAATERGAGCFIELFTANIRDLTPDHATLPVLLASSVFSVFTLISLGLASAFFARRIFSTPFS